MKERLVKHKKILAALSSLAILLAISATVFASYRERRLEEMDVAMSSQETAPVERRTLVESISATGTVVSVMDKDVKADVTGIRVESVSVKVGDVVKAGDVICLLDTSDLEAQLADVRTSLNAVSGKTSVDLSASQRSLQEAEATRNIEAERGDQDIADAWNDYLKALTDLEEAESDYNDAMAATNEKKGEYEYREELLEEAKGRADGISVSTDASGRLELEFSNVKNELASYADKKVGNGMITFEGGMLNNIYIGNPDLPAYLDMGNVKIVGSTARDGEENTAVSSTDTGGDTAHPAGDIGADTVAPAEDTDTSMLEERIDTAGSAPQDASGDEDALLSEIEGLLGKLLEIWSRYVDAKSQEANSMASYEDAQSDYQSLQAEVSEWKQKYNTAKSEESSLKAAYEQAILTADGKLDVYNQQVRSREDTARRNNSTVNSKEDSLAISRLNASTSGLSDKQQIKRYEEQIEECTVTAPIGGVITEMNVEAGDVYAGNVIAVIEDTSDYEIASEIDEYDIGKVKVGQKVVIKTNGTGDLEMEGRVKEIAPRATMGGTGVTYTVVVSMDSYCDELKMDMTAKLSIILESRNNVITVPYNSVQTDEEGGFYIEIVKGTGSGKKAEGAGQDGTAERQTERIAVTKGMESDYYVEITGNGIEEGMEVIVPAVSGGGLDIEELLNNGGPMGGF